MRKPPFRCPHCGYNPGEAADAYLYGSPIRVCAKCKQEYVDRRYHEIAIDGIRFEDINLSPERFVADRKKAFITIIIGVSILVLNLIIAFNSSATISFPVFTFISLLGAVILVSGIDTLMDGTKRSIEKNRAILEQERQISVLRMVNPNYVQKLRTIGYSLKCLNCNRELNQYQPSCPGCNHVITPATDVISITPSRISPTLRKIINLTLAVVIIAITIVGSYNINRHNGKYNFDAGYMEYHGTLSSLEDQQSAALRSYIYHGEVDGRRIDGINCTDYALKYDDGMVDILEDNQTVYKKGLIEESVEFDTYDRFVDAEFCITDLETDHKYYFCYWKDVLDWIEDGR